MALKGVALALGEKKGKHLIVSKIEDFPVLHSAQALERQGFRVTYLPVDGDGLVDLAALEKAIGKDTILVSIQHANQEIGTLQDIAAIAKLCKKKGTLFHTDATHSFARVPLSVKDVPADLVTVSAHTIHGPRGIGGLYIRKKTPIAKWMDGGFQEFDMRAGLENIPGAVGFAKAVELVTEEENTRLQDDARPHHRLPAGRGAPVPTRTDTGPRGHLRTPTSRSISLKGSPSPCTWTCVATR